MDWTRTKAIAWWFAWVFFIFTAIKLVVIVAAQVALAVGFEFYQGEPLAEFLRYLPVLLVAGWLFWKYIIKRAVWP